MCVGGVHVLVGWVKGVERERERERVKNTKERASLRRRRVEKRAGAHTWRTRKCAGAVLRPDENPSQGAARMFRVSFAMFRLFRLW